MARCNYDYRLHDWTEWAPVAGYTRPYETRHCKRCRKKENRPIK